MAKRISSSSINWDLIIREAFTDADKKLCTMFKAKHEKFLRQVTSKPADLPKIDWTYYKNKLSNPAIVDSFQKSYETMTIPFPSDQGLLSEAEKNAPEIKAYGAKLDKENAEKISTLKAKVKELESALPYSEMSLEELYIACPEVRIDPDNPKMWPHGWKDLAEEMAEKEEMERLQKQSEEKEGVKKV